jgi:hypothetical protein
MRLGTLVAIAICETGKLNDLMKIDMSFWAAFFLIGTDLLGRAAVQGVEPGLVSTSIEGRCCYCETVIGVDENE